MGEILLIEELVSSSVRKTRFKLPTMNTSSGWTYTYWLHWVQSIHRQTWLTVTPNTERLLEYTV